MSTYRIGEPYTLPNAGGTGVSLTKVCVERPLAGGWTATPLYAYRWTIAGVDDPVWSIPDHTGRCHAFDTLDDAVDELKRRAEAAPELRESTTMTTADQPYRSASYLAAIHPNQVDRIEGQLDQLPDDNPVKVALAVVLGIDQHVELKVCNTCGAIVHDDLLHGTWHDSLNHLLGRD